MKFSIITVVKNDKDNLLISLNSLLSQTYKDFEYIIYDAKSNQPVIIYLVPLFSTEPV